MTIHPGDQFIPKLAGEVFTRQPKILSQTPGQSVYSASPSALEPGNVIQVTIGLTDVGICDEDERRLLSTHSRINLESHRYEAPPAALFPVLIESVNVDTRRMAGLILHKLHAFGKDGQPFGFEGFSLAASFAELGVEPFEDGTWAADVTTLQNEGEYSPPLYPLSVDQKRSLRSLLQGMKDTAGAHQPLALTRLEAEIKYDEPPVVTVDQLRFLIHQPFMSYEQLHRLTATAHSS